MMTTREGVFAGGDAAAVGYYTAIEAVAAGRRGAAAIHNFLRGERLLPVWDDGRAEARPTDAELAAVEPGQRVPMAVVDGLRRRDRLERGQPRLHGRGGRRRSAALPELRDLLRVRLLRPRLPLRGDRLGPDRDRRGALGGRRHPGHRPPAVRRRPQGAARLRASRQRPDPGPALAPPLRRRPDRGRALPAVGRRRPASASSCSSASARATSRAPATSTARRSAASSPRSTPR